MERDLLKLGPLRPPSCAPASTVNDEERVDTVVTDGVQVTWHRRHKGPCCSLPSSRKLQAMDNAPNVKALEPWSAYEGICGPSSVRGIENENCRYMLGQEKWANLVRIRRGYQCQ